MVSELKILGVILDSKLAFEKQVRAIIAASALRRVSILRKTMSVLIHVSVVANCSLPYLINTPCVELLFFCLDSAATSHLLLLDRVVGRVKQLNGGSVSCDLWHRRRVPSLCVFFKIVSLVGPPVRSLYPAWYVMRTTRGALAAHFQSFEMPRYRTMQFSRSFVLSCIRL